MLWQKTHLALLFFAGFFLPATLKGLFLCDVFVHTVLMSAETAFSATSLHKIVKERKRKIKTLHLWMVMFSRYNIVRLCPQFCEQKSLLADVNIPLLAKRLRGGGKSNV